MAEARWRTYDETNAIAAAPNVTRRTLESGDKLTMLRVELEPGGCVVEHVHPHEQIGTVVSGSVNLRLGTETRQVDAGGCYLIPGDLPHELTAITAAVVIEAFAPVREDLAGL